MIGKGLARHEVTVAGVEMSKRDAVGEKLPGRRQSLAHVAEQEELGRRNTVGMSGNGALADKNVATGQKFSKMVVRPAIAETELEHFTFQIGDQTGGQFEASALRLEPADKAVQPAQRYYAAMPAVSRSCFISASAARS